MAMFFGMGQQQAQQAPPVDAHEDRDGDYPLTLDYLPGMPGRKHGCPPASTAELFREFQHFGLRCSRGSAAAAQGPDAGPTIQLPPGCTMIPRSDILIDKPLADCGSSKVILVKVRRRDFKWSGVPLDPREYVTCVARVVSEPTRQFWREVGVWSVLQHPYIVHFIGVSMSPAGPLSICVHYPEGNLFEANQRLRARAQLMNGGSGTCWGLRAGNTLFCWVRQLAEAMAYLHAFKPWPVVFRNLKSTNVMLADQQTRIALTDFAICRPIASDDELTPAQGSDRWLAPEVMLGDEYDLRCDVFSFALTCWEMVACDVPFANYSSRQAAHLISQGLRPTIPAHCPEWLAMLIAACNAQLPAARPTFEAVSGLFQSATIDSEGLSQAIEGLLRAAESVMVTAVKGKGGNACSASSGASAHGDAMVHGGDESPSASVSSTPPVSRYLSPRHEAVAALRGGAELADGRAAASASPDGMANANAVARNLTQPSPGFQWGSVE